jgi:cytochrome c-type biogenesis protein CcmH
MDQFANVVSLSFRLLPVEGSRWRERKPLKSRRVSYAIGLIVGLLLTAPLSPAALAVEPDEILADSRLEGRARALSTGLRCLVCQNQSIDDSSAPLARDLRLLVRERLSAGETDAQVMRFITDRYGQFVLLNPPVGLNTALLWATPLLLLLAAAVVWQRNRSDAGLATAGSSDQPLTPEEQRRLARVLGQSDKG